MSTVSSNLYDSNEASVLARRSRSIGYDALSTVLLTSKGHDQKVMDQMGLELGINKTSDDHNLSFDSFVRSSENDNNMLFQGEDGMLSNLDFTNGTVSQQSVEEFAVENGLIFNDGDKAYDIVDFGQNKAEFINYQFEGTGDGIANRTPVNLGNSTWGRVNFVNQEIDHTTWMSGRTDSVSLASNEAFSNLIKHRDQWLSATQKAELSRVTTYEEYLEKIAEFACQNLDETGNAEY